MALAERTYSIAVVSRAMDVLEALEASDEPLGTSDLARRLNTTKSAVFRILATFEKRGYVTKDPVTARYALGPRLAVLGERALSSIDLRRIARPVLERLHADFDETVNLGVLESGDIVYIDMVESSHGLRMAAKIGSRHPAHSTALGKAMLAFLPDSELAILLPPHLMAQTDHTITDPHLLRRELQRVRLQGTAEEIGENEHGARCVGVAVFDQRGRPAAAISVSGPDSRIDDDRAAAIAIALRRASRTITWEIGGTWPLDQRHDDPEES
jgi:IclR family transcriptional regulator, KDG regulon repressor